ncbi:MAG: hypothetical protein H7Y42_09870 [Chitinophagaceae bacterium]|nr:hypothetical protein [Chitinophagaceae bacterium]
MEHKIKHIYSALIAGVFLVMAAGSARVNKIHCGAFSYSSTNEDKQENRDYVVLHDGSKVYGEKISWKTGLIVKDQIKVDNEKFRIKETRGYFSNGTYYGRVGSSYARRIVHGKLNVYYTEDFVTSFDSNGRMRTRQVCAHYVQVGEKGDLQAIANQKDIRDYVKDCPKSLEMIDKKDKEIRRSIRKNRFYLNQIFVTFNNDCK